MNTPPYERAVTQAMRAAKGIYMNAKISQASGVKTRLATVDSGFRIKLVVDFFTNCRYRIRDGHAPSFNINVVEHVMTFSHFISICRVFEDIEETVMKGAGGTYL
jgi:hypothetical protein